MREFFWYTIFTMTSTPPPPSRHQRFFRAFLSSVFGTGSSRILGAVRDIALTNFLGAGKVSDAFYIAFTVPSVFRRFVADEGLTGALIPAIAQAEEDQDKQAPQRLVNTTFTALLGANVVLCILGMVFAEWLVKAFA